MPENNAKKLRSQEWWGGNDEYYNFARRAWMRAEGFAPDAFRGKPVIGICNSWSELNNCNAHSGFPEWGQIPMPRVLLNQGIDDMVSGPDKLTLITWGRLVTCGGLVIRLV